MTQTKPNEGNKADPAAGTKASAVAGSATQEQGGTPTRESQRPDPEAGDATPSKAKKEVTTLEEVVISIRRNELTTIPARVWAHEVPILEQVHGEDKLSEEERYDVTVEGFNVRDEWERLRRLYNNKLNPQMVERAYPMGVAQLAEELGIKLDAKDARKKAASSQQEGSAKTTTRKAK